MLMAKVTVRLQACLLQYICGHDPLTR